MSGFDGRIENEQNPSDDNGADLQIDKKLSLGYAIGATFCVFVFWIIVWSMFSIVLLMWSVDLQSADIVVFGMVHRIADGLIRGGFAILVIVVLGKIVNSNGFKYTFSTKGFKKGMFAHIGVLLLVFSMPFIVLSIPEAKLNINNAISIDQLSFVIFHIGNSVWEEALWRGVLMTGALIRWSDTWNERNTIKKRVAFMLICSFAFGLIHFTGGVQQMLFATIGGVVFSAAYIYSKNLLACIIVHALCNYILLFVSTMFYDAELVTILVMRFFIVSIALGILVIPFAIYLTIKAEPFSKSSKCWH